MVDQLLPRRWALLLVLLGLSLVGANRAAAQIGIGTTTPNAKAALDISATDKGLLVPRLTQAQRTAMTSVPDGLMIFQTDGTAGFWYYFGGQWNAIPNATTAGDNLGNHTATQNLNLGANSLVGNGGTTGLTITNGGNVGIGAAAGSYKLLVAGGDTRIAALGTQQALFGLDRLVGFDDLRFYGDDAGTTELMRLTAAGRLGVGTASPTAPLHIAGSVSENIYNGNYGSSLATSANTTASSAASGLPATNIADGVFSTYWYAGSATLPQWFQNDLGAGGGVVRRYRIYYAGVFGNNLKSWTLQGSNDASTWTPVHTVASEPNTAGWHEYYPLNTTSYRYYRINITAIANASTSPAVDEFELYTEGSSTGEVAMRLAQGTMQFTGLAGTGGVRLLGLNADGTVLGLTSTPSGVGDNLGNHTATDVIMAKSGDGDKLALRSDYSVTGPKLGTTGSSLVLSAGRANLGSSESVGDLIVNLVPSSGASLAEVLRVTGANGRVGIGTSTPGAKLDIQGGADASATSDPYALAFSFRSGGFRHFVRSRHNSIVTGTGNALDFYLNNATTSAGSSAPGTGNVHALTMESNNGSPRVGIGTTTPSATLHVVGTAQVTGNVQVTGTETVTSGSVITNTENNGFIFDEGASRRVGFVKYTGREGGIWRTRNAGTLFEIGRVDAGVTALPGSPTSYSTDLAINDNGQVGIGTAAPQTQFHVAGTSGTSNVRLESLGGTGTRVVTADLNGNLSSATAASLDPTTASNGLTKTSNNFTLGGTLSSATTVALNGNNLLFGGTGNVGIGATGTAGGRLTISPTTTEPKITLFDGNDASNHYGLGVSSGQLNYHVRTTAASHVFYGGGRNGDGTELLRISGTGNVGIGTASPGYKLDVSGTTRTTGNAYVSGNVGIGTTVPAAVLDIRGGDDNSGSLGNAALAFQYAGTAGYRHFVRSRHSSNLAAGGNAIDFLLNNSGTSGGSSAPGTGNLPVLTLESNNNQPRVGIGTTAPLATLEVSGATSTVKLGGLAGTGTRVVTADASGSLSTVTTASLADNLGNHTATQNLNLATFKLVGNGGTSGLSLSSGGRLGLGTTSPTAWLHSVTGGANDFNNDYLFEDFRAGNATTQYMVQRAANGTSAAPTTLGDGTTTGINIGGYMFSPYTTAGYPGFGYGETGVEGLYRGDGTTALTELQFHTSGSTRMTLSPTGQLGLGTTDPGATLEVGGQVSPDLLLHSNSNSDVTGGTLKFRESTTDFGWNLRHNTGGAEESTSEDRLVLEKLYLGTASPVMSWMQGSSRVGIGTANPQATFHVSGSTTTVRFDGLGGTGTRYVTVDSNGNLTTAALGASESTTASNGLTLSGLDVRLGGTLGSATTVGTTAANSLTVNGAGTVNLGTGTGAVNVGNTTGAMAVTGNSIGLTGTTNINTAGSAATNVGTSATAGTVTIGRTSGTTNVNGTVTLGSLTGASTRMVTVTAAGALGTATVPTGESTTASNGLTLTGSNVTLGGTLTDATTIAQANNFLALTGGGVGIGTTSATDGARMTIRTSSTTETGVFVGLTGASTANSLKLEHNGSNFIVRPATAGGTSTVVENTGGGALLINPSVGNVGIGTSSPTTKLDVNGGVAIESNNTMEFGASMSGKEINAGKIGYQTFTAGALDIVGAGTATANRQIKLWAEGGLTVSGPLTAGGKIDLGTNALVGNGGITGLTVSNAGAVTVGNLTGASTQMVTASSAGVLSTATIPTGESTTASNGLTLTGANVTLGGILTSATTIATNGSNLSVTGTGNVGIGTSSPTAKLHVGGTAAIDGASALEFGAGVSGKELNAGKIGYQTFTTGALDIVGAGTTNTNRKLKLWAEGGTQFTGPITAGGKVDLSTNALVGNGGTTGLTISSAGAVTVGNLTGASTRMVTADNTGALSTATIPAGESTTAANGLTMNGTAVELGGTLTQNTTISTGGFGLGLSATSTNILSLTSSASVGTWLNMANTGTGGSQWSLISTGPGNGEGGGKLLVRDHTTGNVRATFDTDGDFGIGTSAPAYRLQVVGGNTRLAATGAEQSLFGLDQLVGLNDLRFYTDDAGATERMRIEGDGDVGIGTITPATKLDVNGGVKLGSNGTVLAAVIKATVNKDLPNILADNGSAQTFTVANAATGATVYVSPASALTAGLMVQYARVSAAGTVEVMFYNSSGSPINMGAMDFYLTVIQ